MIFSYSFWIKRCHFFVYVAFYNNLNSYIIDETGSGDLPGKMKIYWLLKIMKFMPILGHVMLIKG